MTNLCQRFEKVRIPATPVELDLLTASVLKYGCLIPLVTWKDTLIDGHERLKICQENDIPFETTEKHFDNDSDAIAWILKHQFATRHLLAYERCMKVLQYEPEILEFLKKRQSAVFKRRKMPGFLLSSEALAWFAGVSYGTFIKARELREANDKDALLIAVTSINKGYEYLVNKERQLIKSV